MPDLPLVEAVARELHRANNCCCYGWDEEGAKHREPFLRRSREVVTDATAEQAAEVERLQRRVDDLERDLAVFTKEPGVLARIGHEHVTYWYNQTRLRDADVERLRSALLAARLGAADPRGYIGYRLGGEQGQTAHDWDYNYQCLRCGRFEHDPGIGEPCTGTGHPMVICCAEHSAELAAAAVADYRSSRRETDR